MNQSLNIDQHFEVNQQEPGYSWKCNIVLQNLQLRKSSLVGVDFQQYPEFVLFLNLLISFYAIKV